MLLQVYHSGVSQDTDVEKASLAYKSVTAAYIVLSQLNLVNKFGNLSIKLFHNDAQNQNIDILE